MCGNGKMVYICDMKWNGLLLLIGLTVSAVVANAQQLDDGFQSVQAQVVGTLDPLLDNTSSLFYWEGDLWTCNDHGEVVFHALDTTTGAILRSVATGVMPSDMEEVAQDDAYFYLGDFGNNHEYLRTDLRVLRFLKSDLLAGRIRPDTIAFVYEGYDPSVVKGKGLPTTDFDCEAMVAGTDSRPNSGPPGDAACPSLLWFGHRVLLPAARGRDAGALWLQYYLPAVCVAAVWV